jgi:hypothetical protein
MAAEGPAHTEYDPSRDFSDQKFRHLEQKTYDTIWFLRIGAITLFSLIVAIFLVFACCGLRLRNYVTRTKRAQAFWNKTFQEGYDPSLGGMLKAPKESSLFARLFHAIVPFNSRRSLPAHACTYTLTNAPPSSTQQGSPDKRLTMLSAHARHSTSSSLPRSVAGLPFASPRRKPPPPQVAPSPQTLSRSSSSSTFAGDVGTEEIARVAVHAETDK